MVLEKEYSEKWENSSRFFKENNYYNWMCAFLKPYETILEIGCGTGYSTLSLLEAGHNVISVDNNQYCIDATKELIAKTRPEESRVQFYKTDFITDEMLKEQLAKSSIDCITCWNIGTFYTIEKVKGYLPYFDEYGLPREQVASNLANSYSELILWNACKLARSKGSAMHIVERTQEIINSANGKYYLLLAAENGFGDVSFDNMNGLSLSDDGINLERQGKILHGETIPVIFNSILLTQGVSDMWF